MSKATTRQSLAKPYMWLVIGLGLVACAFTVVRLQPSELGWRFALVSVLTLGFGSRVVVQIPRVRGQISVSDTFIFLVLLLFGGEAAILMAAADAFFSSRRIALKGLTVAFNSSVYVCSTFLTVWALRLAFGNIRALAHGDQSQYIIAVCLVALVQYAANSGLVAVGVALKAGQPLWQMWRHNFLWTSLTYFAGASAAGIIAKLIAAFGLYAFLAAAPIVVVVYFTYCTYLKNVESSTKQAELARQHALEVQQHMEALRESEERFRSAFDYATIGMGVVSLDGRWLQVNRSLCEIIGYAGPELLAANIKEITHREDLFALDEQIQRLAEGAISSQRGLIDTIQKAVHSGQIRAFYGNDYSGPFAKGDLLATMSWSGDIVQLQADNPNLKWQLPDTGGDIWTDNMLIPKGGDVYTASVYMNFVYDPKIAAEIEDYVNYVCPVVGAKQALLKLDPGVAKNPLIFPTKQMLDNVHVIDPTALNNQKYQTTWQNLISA